MTISVHKAVSLPKDSPWFSHALPTGFPFLVIDEQSKIIEPALLFLIHTHLKRGPRHWKKQQHTANAIAYDLKDWFDYLAHCEWVNPVTKKLQVGKPWDIAAESDYIVWRDTMQELVSPQTNRHLASRTISRRQGYVERFYEHAQKQGWYDGEFVISKVKKGRIADNTNQGEFTPENNSVNAGGTVSEYRERMEYGEPVRPLSDDEWQRIQLKLGPLPSERKFNLRPSRDRLASELTIGTGMRVDEVTSLTEFHLHGLHQAWLAADEEQRRDGFFGLYIVKTKRLKPRTVFVPGYLIPELMAYMDEEREASIKRGEARANRKGQKYVRPTSLFVNHTESAEHSGNAVKATSVSWAFKKACLDARITHSVEKIDIETNERYRVNLSKHPFVPPAGRERLFIFATEQGDRVFKPFVGTSTATGDNTWRNSLRRFYDDNGLPQTALNRFRPTGLDFTDVLFGGDIRAKQAAANHASAETTYRLYSTDAQKQRGDEFLGQVGQLRRRWRESRGKVDPRNKPDGSDVGAATPGWTCVDPFSGPYTPNKLCNRYGSCPACPHGSIALDDPYALAQAWNLLYAIDEAAVEIAPDAWLTRWAPIKEKLLQVWLPSFTNLIQEQAKRIKLAKLPALD